MPEDNLQPQSQPNLQSSDATNKMVLRIGTLIGVLVVLAILAIIVVIVGVDSVGRLAEEEKSQSTAQETESTKLTFSVPNVDGYTKELALSSSDRDLYAYMPATDELKKLVSNVNFVVYRSEDPAKKAKDEMELTTKDQKSISLTGAEGAYSGCAEEATEESYKYKYDYEACAVSFYKADTVVLVEARAALDIREKATKETGDKLLAEASKISTAFLATVK